MSTVDPNDYPCTVRRRPLREGDGSAPPMPWEELRFASERAAMEDIEHPAEPLRGAWLYRVTFPAPLARIVEAGTPDEMRSRVYVVRTDDVVELTLQQGDVVAVSADVDFVHAWEHVEDPAMLFRVACSVSCGTQLAAAAWIADAMLRLARRMVNVRDQQTARSEAGSCQGGGSRVVLEVLDVWTRSRATLAPLLDGVTVEAYLCAAIREAVTIDAVALELERQALAREKAAAAIAARVREAGAQFVGLPNSAENRAALAKTLRRDLAADFDTERAFAEVEALFRRRPFGVGPVELLRDAMERGGPSGPLRSITDVRADVTMGGTNYTVMFANGAELTLTSEGRYVRSSYDTRSYERRGAVDGSDAADALALALNSFRSDRR